MWLAEIFSTLHRFWEESIPSSKKNTPFLQENKLFTRETRFLIRLSITLLGGRGSSGIWREASPPKIRWSPGFQIVGFEPGSTE